MQFHRWAIRVFPREPSAFWIWDLTGCWRSNSSTVWLGPYSRTFSYPTSFVGSLKNTVSKIMWTLLYANWEFNFNITGINIKLVLCLLLLQLLGKLSFRPESKTTVLFRGSELILSLTKILPKESWNVSKKSCRGDEESAHQFIPKIFSGVYV